MSNKLAIIPNSFTMTNMVFGFLAILFASRGDSGSVAVAGVLVFVGTFFDLFDGAAARALKVDNPIGMQLDSLADAISYGIAPGVIAYQGFLHKLPYCGLGLDWGMIIAPLFPICATYRLARFNIGEEEGGFSGLPSPAAGAIIASMVSVSLLPASNTTKIIGYGNYAMQVPMEIFVIVYVATALLMVSNFDYKKMFSDIWHMGKAARIITIIIVIALLITIRMWAVFLFTSIYITVGILNNIRHLIMDKE